MDIVIDWTKLITKEMKDAEHNAEVATQNTAKLQALIKQANAQVASLNGRVSTLDYLINEQDPDDEDYIEPSAAEIAELPVRKAQLKSWNSYNVKLSRLTTSAGWPLNPVWPVMPEPYTNELSAVATPAA